MNTDQILLNVTVDATHANMTAAFGVPNVSNNYASPLVSPAQIHNNRHCNHRLSDSCVLVRKNSTVTAACPVNIEFSENRK